MISYIKSKTNEFKTCEDSITSGVFDLMKCLPHRVFWQVLSDSLYGSIQIEPEDFKSFNFWPMWDSSEIETVGNKNFIEPDIFIECDSFDVIIEAKRYDENQQSESQHINQINTYNHKFGEGQKKQLYYIQVGGLKDKHKTNELEGAIMCKTDWSSLLNSVRKVQTEQQNSHTLRLLSEIEEAFIFFGFQKRQWLSEITLDSKTESDMKNDVKFTLEQVRNSYRLLYKYQKSILDLVSFIGDCYRLYYSGGYPQFCNSAPRSGQGKLSNWAWDWLGMYFYEFHFKIEKNKDDFRFALFLLSDTGFFGELHTGGNKDKLNVDEFGDAKSSSSRLIFVAGKGYWKGWGKNWDEKEFLMQEEGKKEAKDDKESEIKDGIMYFKRYDLDQLSTEDGAMKCVKDFAEQCKHRDIILEVKEPNRQLNPK